MRPAGRLPGRQPGAAGLAGRRQARGGGGGRTHVPQAPVRFLASAQLPHQRASRGSRGAARSRGTTRQRGASRAAAAHSTWHRGRVSAALPPRGMQRRPALLVLRGTPAAGLGAGGRRSSRRDCGSGGRDLGAAWGGGRSSLRCGVPRLVGFTHCMCVNAGLHVGVVRTCARDGDGERRQQLRGMVGQQLPLQDAAAAAALRCVAERLDCGQTPGRCTCCIVKN